MDTRQAIETARLWKAGKLIGGDEDEVRNALLDEVDRLHDALKMCAGLVETYGKPEVKEKLKAALTR